MCSGSLYSLFSSSFTGAWLWDWVAYFRTVVFTQYKTGHIAIFKTEARELQAFGILRNPDMMLFLSGAHNNIVDHYILSGSPASVYAKIINSNTVCFLHDVAIVYNWNNAILTRRFPYIISHFLFYHLHTQIFWRINSSLNSTHLLFFYVQWLIRIDVTRWATILEKDQ